MQTQRFRTIAALALAFMVFLPVLTVVGIALWPRENIWPHLMATVLPRYLKTTFLLAFIVGLGASIIGTALAFWAVHYRFVGRRWLQYAVFLPLSMPAYIGAFALVDFFEYAGPLQTALRDIFGWQSSREYWFPPIRTLGGAALVLTFTLYPYVYLLARASFQKQSANGLDVSKSMGLSDWSYFRRVALPLARPAIVAGVVLVLMESVNDFGTVDYFAVQTLTTGIFSIWLEASNAGGAAQIALCVLALVFVMYSIEQLARKRAKFHNPARMNRPITARPISRACSAAICSAFITCLCLGFVLPAGILLYHTLNASSLALDAILQAIWHSLILGFVTAALCVALTFWISFSLRGKGGKILIRLCTMGYAMPGAVLGLGVLLSLSRFDHWLADGIAWFSGIEIGLLLTGGAGAIVFAYTVRFCAIGFGAAEAGFAGISPNLPLAAQSLGAQPHVLLTRIFAPLMRPHLATAALLIFVDVIKELPATLLLRPFNYETLATHTYMFASLENIAQASPSALIIVLISMLAVLLLAKTSK